MKYTITRALSELKTLKARYEREVSDAKLVGVSVTKKMTSPYTSYTPEEFTKQAKSQWQSLCDIEKRILVIKKNIAKSNYETKVKIGDQEMTVLEAIELKDLISLKESRLVTLKRQLKIAREKYEEAEENNREKIDKNLADQTAAGNKDKDLEARIKDSIDKLYPVEMIDPIKAEEAIKELENYIEKFKGEVDFVLSESNSLTYIEVPD